MTGELATLAIHHIFDVAEDTNKLSQSNADHFHHFLAELLYLSIRALP